MLLRRTKIVATLGPASASPETVRALLEAGMDVGRINCSHGDPEQHRKTIQALRQASAETGKPLAILLDLSGPKLRIGEIPQGELVLEQGREVRLSLQAASAVAGNLPIPSCPWLPREVKAGERILLDDGAIQLLVKQAAADEVICEVLVGGPISSHKGINLPDTALHELEIPTEKDRADLAFGLGEAVDYVAQSFVRTAAEVRAVNQILRQAAAPARLIAKIEKREALDNIQAILEEADGVMVARGDLGVETDLETVALKQKEIISLANQRGKLVITATQMLESMIEHPTPTRAEVSDVTNAILDGTDALMLSGETAVGKYPVEAVRVMASIAAKTDAVFPSERWLRRDALSETSISAAVAHAVCLLARDLSAAAILTATESGRTALLVARHRPAMPILAMSANQATVRQLALAWGVQPVWLDSLSTTDELFEKAKQTALRSGLVRAGDRVVITAGVPVRQPGATNLIKTEVL
jgi:pyruvate kinase